MARFVRAGAIAVVLMVGSICFGGCAVQSADEGMRGANRAGDDGDGDPDPDPGGGLDAKKVACGVALTKCAADVTKNGVKLSAECTACLAGGELSGICFKCLADLGPTVVSCAGAATACYFAYCAPDVACGGKGADRWQCGTWKDPCGIISNRNCGGCSGTNVCVDDDHRCHDVCSGIADGTCLKYNGQLCNKCGSGKTCKQVPHTSGTNPSDYFCSDAPPSDCDGVTLGSNQCVVLSNGITCGCNPETTYCSPETGTYGHCKPYPTSGG